MTRPNCPDRSPKALQMTRRLASLVLLVFLVSCGKGDKEASGSKKSKSPPVHPTDALRAVGSGANRPPGFPTSLIGKADQAPTRIFKVLRSAEAVELDELATIYRTATDPYERIAAIEAMSDHYSEKLLEILDEVLDDESVEVRAAAMGILAGSTSTTVMPLAEKALADPEDSVRLTVPEMVRSIPDLAIIPIFTKGLGDASSEVRYAFLDAANEMGPEIREPVLEAGLRTGDEEIRDLSLTLLKAGISHSSFDIIIDALDSQDPNFRQDVSMQIDLLVGQTFSNSAEARAWWTANKRNYDEELFLRE